MKIKKIIYILLFLNIISPVYGGMPVIDTTNLIQNIEQTLRSVHIESAAMAELANDAKSLGHEVQMIMNLHNQVLLAKQNIENVATLVREGKYKSFQELNQMCYSIQRVGRTVDGVGRSFKRLFPDTYELIKEEQRRKILKEQEEEIDNASDDAIGVQDYLKDEEEAKKVDNDINAIMTRMQTVAGIKGALQLQAQLIVLLIDENRKLDTLLASSLQVSTLESKKAMSEKKAQRKEHKQFMKGWGEAKSKKTVLTEFP